LISKNKFNDKDCIFIDDECKKEIKNDIKLFYDILNLYIKKDGGSKNTF